MPPVPAPIVAPRSWSFAPIGGFATLDKTPSGVSVITHRMTFESFTLPGLQWMLEFDDEEFGIVVPVDQGSEARQPVLLEDRLCFQWWARSNNDFVITHRDRGDQAVHLDSNMMKWSSSTLTVRAGPNRISFEFDIAQFRWPRTGARMAVSLKSCYQALGLDQFKGQQWRWVAGSWQRWRSHLGSFGLGEHVLATGAMEACLMQWGWTGSTGSQCDSFPLPLESYCRFP